MANTNNTPTAILTEVQRHALRLMSEQSIGAMPVKGFGWIFPTHIRNDYGQFGDDRAIALAEQIVNRLEVNQCY